MDNASTLPLNQDQKKYRQDEERKDENKRGFEQGEGQGSSGSNYEPRQEEETSGGYQEDEPGNPVRTTGSTREDQESGAVQPGDDREGKH
jgi:hypothetical protein